MHTPGPWHIDADDFAGTGLIESEFGAIAKVLGHNNADDETLPNAHMLAAASKMYEALELCMARLQHKADTCRKGAWKLSDQVACEAAHAALAKARGEEAI